MLTPVLRMVSAALEDEIAGVGAMLNLLPLDDPSDLKPDPPSIIVPPDHDLAAQGPPSNPTTAASYNWPILVITSENPASVKMTGMVGKGMEIPNLFVHLVYVTGSVGDPAKGWTYADYTFRAVMHSLQSALFAVDKTAARSRGPANDKGKVTIHGLNNMSYHPGFVELSRGQILGELILDLHIRLFPLV